MVKNADVDIHLPAPPIYEASRASQALWLAPISFSNHPPPLRHPLQLHQANSAYHQPTKIALAQSLHATAGYSAKSTFYKAIGNGVFTTWPGLTSDHSLEHLPLSVLSIMGRMRQIPKGVRSTSKPPVPLLFKPLLAPPRSHVSCNHLVSPTAIEFDILNTMISTDQPGRFSFTSNHEMNYIILFYDFDSNEILVHSIKSTQAEHLIEGYNAHFKKLKAANKTPILLKLNNEISNSMHIAINTKNLKYQVADTYDHRANSTKRAIGTFKNHFTAILSGCDCQFPLSLSCSLLAQAEIAVNLLQPSCTNPKLSAYHQVFGIFDFNSTLMAALVTQVIIPKSQHKSTFASQHGTSGWYIDPAPHHYHNYKIYDPVT